MDDYDEKLAADGNARAMNNLAQIYLKGFSIIERSYEKAVELFQKAAALNEVYALFCLGELFHKSR
ncbi:MAG: SEL1-like repeat protein, partial [Selenomonadaceae bacterium]|nr:SEL1-like repeat protein [Selenomonadaceae bacterium]